MVFLCLLWNGKSLSSAHPELTTASISPRKGWCKLRGKQGGKESLRGFLRVHSVLI